MAERRKGSSSSPAFFDQLCGVAPGHRSEHRHSRTASPVNPPSLKTKSKTSPSLAPLPLQPPLTAQRSTPTISPATPVPSIQGAIFLNRAVGKFLRSKIATPKPTRPLTPPTPQLSLADLSSSPIEAGQVLLPQIDTALAARQITLPCINLLTPSVPQTTVPSSPGSQVLEGSKLVPSQLLFDQAIGGLNTALNKAKKQFALDQTQLLYSWHIDTGTAVLQPDTKARSYTVLKGADCRARDTLAAAAQHNVIAHVPEVNGHPLEIHLIEPVELLANGRLLVTLPEHTSSPCAACAYVVPLGADYNACPWSADDAQKLEEALSKVSSRYIPVEEETSAQVPDPIALQSPSDIPKAVHTKSPLEVLLGYNSRKEQLSTDWTVQTRAELIKLGTHSPLSAMSTPLMPKSVFEAPASPKQRRRSGMMSPNISRKARDPEESAALRRPSAAVGRSATRAGPTTGRSKNSLHFSLRSELDEHKDWATTPQDVYNPRRQTMQEWAYGRAQAQLCRQANASPAVPLSLPKHAKAWPPSGAMPGKANVAAAGAYQTYAQGGKFLELSRGTGTIYYPSGRAALVVSHAGQGTYVWAYSDSATATLLASFSPLAGGCCYWGDGSNRVVCTATGLTCFDELAAQTIQHDWQSNARFAHAVHLNDNVVVNIRSRTDVSITYRSEGQALAEMVEPAEIPLLAAAMLPVPLAPADSTSLTRIFSINVNQRIPTVTKSLRIDPVASSQFKGLQRKAEALLEVLTTTASTLTVHTAGRRTLGAATQEAITRQVSAILSRYHEAAFQDTDASDATVSVVALPAGLRRPKTAPEARRRQPTASLQRAKTPQPGKRPKTPAAMYCLSGHKIQRSSPVCGCVVGRIPTVNDQEVARFLKMTCSSALVLAVTADGDQESQQLVKVVKAAYAKYVKANNGQCRGQAHGAHARLGIYNISKPNSAGFVKRNQVSPGVLLVLDSTIKLRFVGRHDGGRPWSEAGVQRLLVDWSQRPSLPWDFAGCV